MNITVIGVGYVGLTTGVCFSNYGNNVICVDSDVDKIKKLNSGILPIYEPGLKDVFDNNVKAKRLIFTSDIKLGIQNSDIIFIAVGTPEKDDGRPDLSYVEKVAENIGKYMNRYKVIVNKSTVPLGTADRVSEIILKNQKKKYAFDVVSNPEFLREGTAVRDFSVPDRIVIGVESQKAKQIMSSLYGAIVRTGKPLFITDVKSAEMIKYASNAMLASRISFMNSLACLCEKTGADIKEVAKGMGLDSRIGPRFLQAGVGYGGSCFPKDVQALAHMMKDYDCDASLIDSIEHINDLQKKSLLPKISRLLKGIKDKRVAIWGLAFKPKTDDIREAPSLTLIKQLQDSGALITAFDPVAQDNAKKIIKNISYADNPYDAIKGADCLVIVTEWDEFRELDFKKIKDMMKNPNIVDGRNIYSPSEMKRLGFNYVSVGRK